MTRHARLEPRVVRSQAIGWVVFGATTVGAAAVLTTFARIVAGAIPYAGAPLLAGAAALGVVLALAAALARSSGRTSATGN